MRSSAVALQ